LGSFVEKLALEILLGEIPLGAGIAEETARAQLDMEEAGMVTLMLHSVTVWPATDGLFSERPRGVSAEKERAGRFAATGQELSQGWLRPGPKPTRAL